MSITYIGPEQKGPHYVESGKRPDPGIENPTKVIMQLTDGSICFGGYGSPGSLAGKPYDEEFWIIGSAEIVTPVCWWHLPDPVPMTEREWWMAQEWEIRLEWNDARFRNYCYSDMNLYAGGLLNKIGYYDSLAEAKAAAYNHWVEAGRP